MLLNYIKTSENAVEPFKKFPEDAGYDLYATWKKEEKKYIEYGTNITFEIPTGYVGLLFPRSSVTNTDLMLKNCVGVIDATYRGEIKFRFIRSVHGIILPIDGGIDVSMVGEPISEYPVGERVGQIVFLQLPNISLNLVSQLSETLRGAGGYGHTGNK